jgi:hypothetical protein
MKKRILSKEEHQAYVVELSDWLKSRRGQTWGIAARDHYRLLLTKYGIAEVKPLPAEKP